MLCTETQHLFKKFITILRGSKIKSGSPCDIICYIYSGKNNTAIAITSLIDLEKINLFLREALRMLLYEKNKSRYVKIFIKGSGVLLAQLAQGIKKQELYKLIFRVLFVTMHSIIFRNKLVNRVNLFFKIGVSSFLDKNNADFDLFEKCDLHIKYPDGTYGPYCKRNIVFGKYK